MNRITLIPYMGGKYNLINETVPIIEWCADEHKLTGYLEVCGGGARQLLNISPGKFAYKLYNDKDLGLCKLFECLKNPKLTRDMINKLLIIEYTEENFYKAKDFYDKQDTDIVTAAAYTFLLACQSRAGNMQSFDRNCIEINREKEESLYHARVLKLQSLHVILDGLDVKNQDALSILKTNADRSDYFVTIDPPYVKSAKKSANKTYKNDSFDHVKMVDLLLESKMKVMLCGYDNHKCYERLNELNGWHKIFLKELFVASSAVAGTTAEEFIWVNFDIPKYILRR